MTVRISGSDFKRYYDSLPNGVWHEGEEVYIEGALVDESYNLAQVPDGADVRIIGGCIYSDSDDEYERSFESDIKAWLKKQRRRHLLIECDVDSLEDIKGAVRRLGAKVLK